MEKSNKKILILMIIVITIIIVVLALLLISNKKKKNENMDIENLSTEQPEVKEEEKKISEEKYFDITTIIRKYYDAINKDNYVTGDGENFANKDFVKQNIYKVLSTEYIDNENITIENLYDYIPDINEKVTFVPTSMELYAGEVVDKFLVRGIEIHMNSKEVIDTTIIVSIDKTNQTFSIEPIDRERDNIKIENKNVEIAKNDYNEYEPYNPSEKELVIEKFNNYKLLILNKSDKLYDMLDEKYRDKKFGNYEEFKQYIDNNYETLSTMKLSKYQKQENDYVEYICIDSNNKYVIFKDNVIMLDTYTIDLPEFIEKYNKANESQKVGYNIEKFISAINDKDYKYAYNLLDEVYRKNNIPTLEDFEEYVKRNMYENNKVEHQGVEKQGNNFIYEIKLKDANDENSEEKSMTIIMQLKEGTDFVMSFSME